MRRQSDRTSAEARFRGVFAHLGLVTAYARRRGSPDPEAVAAEVMTVAWRRLADVPLDDPRPWLYATARNVLLAEWRLRSRADTWTDLRESRAAADEVPLHELMDADVLAALRSLTVADREALLLVAWEDLSPKLAAEALDIGHAAFRVRLHRARARFRRALEDGRRAGLAAMPLNPLEVEER